jgi:cytochrome c-type biogenesis protein CcmH/NrfG
MGSFALVHALMGLVVFVAVPLLTIWLALRTYRAGTKDSVPSRLQQLGQLRQQGLLTDEEFERKRAELAHKL